MAPETRQNPSLAAILAVADRQHGVVTRAQLLGCGLSEDSIRHRVRNGRLWRVHPKIFAVGRPTLTREGEWMAAVLACGRGAVLSHICAAELWNVWERPSPSRPQVSVPTYAGRRAPKGIDLVRAATLRPDYVTERNAIPVTTLPRTLIDLASVLDAKQLKSALRQAERRHRLDLQRLRESVAEAAPQSTRHARLRHVLDDHVPGAGGTEGEPEAAFLELCAKHGISLPQTQVPIGRYRADFLWQDLNLVVEIDDRSSHDGYIAFHDDRVRDRALKAAGLDVLRFTRNEVARGPGKVARELSQQIARRRPEE